MIPRNYKKTADSLMLFLLYICFSILSRFSGLGFHVLVSAFQEDTEISIRGISLEFIILMKYKVTSVWRQLPGNFFSPRYFK